MGWARLDDRFHDHPKVADAGLEATGLFVMCLTWANANRNRSGVVPESVVRRFTGPRRFTKLTATLHRVGLFDDPVPDGWPIHDYAVYLPKYDVEHLREAGRKGGKARASGKQTAKQSASEPAESAEQIQASRASARRNPVPVPEPLPQEQRVESSRGGAPQVTRASTEPPRRCPRHRDQPAQGACGPCGDARREHQQWERDREQARRDAGPVVGGHECPDHPGQPAGRCGRCPATAAPLPEGGVRALAARLRDDTPKDAA